MTRELDGGGHGVPDPDVRLRYGRYRGRDALDPDQADRGHE